MVTGGLGNIHILYIISIEHVFRCRWSREYTYMYVFVYCISSALNMVLGAVLSGIHIYCITKCFQVQCSREYTYTADQNVFRWWTREYTHTVYQNIFRCSGLGNLCTMINMLHIKMFSGNIHNVLHLEMFSGGGLLNIHTLHLEIFSGGGLGHTDTLHIKMFSGVVVSGIYIHCT